jgi:hypothetical protein
MREETTMDLGEARELREELEAIEALMDRIKAKAKEMPDLADLEATAGTILGTMQAVIEKAEDMPGEDEFADLDAGLSGILGTMKAIIEKSEEMPAE